MNNLQKLLTVLKQSDTPLSSRQLSSLLSVSDRSVRNYIKELRNAGEQITANENGYLWIGIKNDEPDSPGNKSQALFAFATPEERINYIIEKLILAKSGLDLYDLADSIYISYSTIEKDMIRVIKTAAEDETSSQIVLDATGRKNGRGAYVCPNSECLRAAIKNKGLERSLKMPIPKEVYDTLTKEMEKFETR